MGRRTIFAIGVAVGVMAAGATVAVARIPNSTTGVIDACVDDSSGALRAIDAQRGARCRKDEQSLRWNQRGARGRTGPTGPSGSTGRYIVKDATGTVMGDLYAVDDIRRFVVVWDGDQYVLHTEDEVGVVIDWGHVVAFAQVDCGGQPYLYGNVFEMVGIDVAARVHTPTGIKGALPTGASESITILSAYSYGPPSGTSACFNLLNPVPVDARPVEIQDLLIAKPPFRIEPADG